MWWSSGDPSKSQRDAQWSGWWAPTSASTADRFQHQSLDSELKSLGLKRVPISADGNCFFRAATDQLEGTKGDHAKLRQAVVAFMEAHRSDYEPFVEDDEPFDHYCRRMRKDGTWAGNMEVQALSMLKKVNVCIHQTAQPLWLIPNFPDRTDFIHLTYEGGDHYNSVRRMSDTSDGPAGPMTIADVSEAMARSRAAKAGGDQGKPEEPSTSGRKPGAGQEKPPPLPPRKGAQDGAQRRGQAASGSGSGAGAGRARDSLKAAKGRGDAPDSGPNVEHRASIVQLNDLDIAYEVFGPANGPAIVFTPGWRSDKSSLRWLAHAFGRRGYRALVWDRPNCGASSVCFEGGPSPSSRAGGSECEMQAGVLADLIEHLNMAPAVLFGTSNGGRLSLCFASAYPELCAGLILNNLTAGPLAAQCLSRKYYLRYADVIDMYGSSKEAMTFLCKEQLFEELCEANPDNRARLLATPPQVFRERMRQWGNALQGGGNATAFPVLGIAAARVRGVRAPALCLHTFRKESDGMHTLECMEAVSRLLPGADGRVVASADKEVWVKAVNDFMDGLPKPLQGSAPVRPALPPRGRAATSGSDAQVSLANRCVPSPVGNVLSSIQATIATGAVAGPRFAQQPQLGGGGGGGGVAPVLAAGANGGRSSSAGSLQAGGPHQQQQVAGGGAAPGSSPQPAAAADGSYCTVM